MAELARCTRCVLPETHETIVFDEEGVCNICNQHHYKQQVIDWEQQKAELDRIVEEHRGKYEYDCIVPFSGGKDSTFTLFYLVKEYGIRPLVVSFDHGFLRPQVLENSKRTIRQLGVAHHVFTPNWHVVRKLMLQALLEKGDFCWHCHTGIFAYPMWVALQQQVPLVIWGEPSSEYTAYYTYEQDEAVDEKRFNRYVNLGITAQDMHFRLGGKVDARDLRPFEYPPLKDLRQLQYRSICLGSYIPWDTRKQSQLIHDELGWEGDHVENVPPGYEYEKIECYMQGVRDYIKFLKRGYTRPSHLASLDIRNHRMSREDGVALVEKYEGKRPPSLDLFLDFVGLTEDEFNEIVLTHVVSPHEPDFAAIEKGDRMPDFDRWAKSGGMPRGETEVLIRRWRDRHPSVAGSAG